MLINVQRLGQIDYGPALKLQQELVAKRVIEEIPDTLLLLEHPHTYTVGLDGHREHLHLSNEALTRLNITFHKADRSGGVTYHGPGQVMAYPILDLSHHGYDYHRYVYQLEAVILQVLSGFNLRAFRRGDRRGIWVGPNLSVLRDEEWNEIKDQPARIGNVGVKVDRHQITSHGFSININPDLTYFGWIMPEGIEDFNITSLSQILKKEIDTETVLEMITQSFCRVFDTEVLLCPPEATKQK